MKDWIQRWLGIEKPSKHDFEDLAASAVEALAKAKDAHISDLRLLIDKGHDREAQLSKLVQMAMEHHYYRPTVTGTPSANHSTPAIPPEHLQDVEPYDEAADTEMVREQQEELQALLAEQNEKGINKVAA